MTDGRMLVVVRGITVMSQQIPKAELQIAGIRLNVWSGFPVEKISMWGKLPGRRYRIAAPPTPTSLQVKVDHNLIYAQWRVEFAGDRIDQAIQTIRAKPSDITAIVAALQPFRNYVEQRFSIVHK